MPDSPAVNAGSNALAAGLTTDQRGAGFARIFGGTVDIGAFELQPVAVGGVAVTWGTAGFSALQTASDGLRLLPAGRKTGLPWLGIDQVIITLNQSETLTPADVTITGVRGINYGPVTIVQKTIELDGSVAYTLKLAEPIEAADRVTITISGANIVAFTRRMDVLPGDFNDDGVVSQKDVNGVRAELKRLHGAQPTSFGEILGDGTVEQSDYKVVKKRVGTKLPKLGAKAHKAALARTFARKHIGIKARH